MPFRYPSLNIVALIALLACRQMTARWGVRSLPRAIVVLMLVLVCQ